MTELLRESVSIALMASPQDRSALPRLAHELRDAIIAGRYAPGERLSEHAVAEAFGVSRNTLRESFQVLAEQGLITRVPNRGVSVAAPTMADVIDIYRARRILEVGALADASPLHPAFPDMQAAVASARDAEHERDWAAVGTANMQFHSALVRFSDSPRIISAFENIVAELRLAFLRLNDAERLHQPFMGRNEVIVASIDSGSREEAVTVLTDYLADSERVMLSTYTRLGLS